MTRIPAVSTDGPALTARRMPAHFCSRLSAELNAAVSAALTAQTRFHRFRETVVLQICLPRPQAL